MNFYGWAMDMLTGIAACFISLVDALLFLVAQDYCW